MVVLTAYNDEMSLISTGCHQNPGEQQQDQDTESYSNLVYATTA